MDNSVFHRRRVERFAQLLEEAGRRRHSRSPLDDELLEYVELSQRVRDVAQPGEATPEEDFRTSLRAMLVATAQREGIGRTADAAGAVPVRAGKAGRPAQNDEGGTRPVRVGLRSRRTRGAIIVGLAAGTLALSGMSAASGDAMPGDPLYTVKLSTESARLALTTNDALRGQLFLDFAANRANEARARRDDPADLANLLAAMDDQTMQGIRLLTGWVVEHHDPSSLDFINAWVTTQRARLAGLASGPGAQRVQQSIGLLAEIQGRSAKLRTALGCRVVSTHTDQLGPVPAECSPGGGTGSGSGTRGGTSGGSSGNLGTSSGGGTTPRTGGAPSPTVAPSPSEIPQPSPTDGGNPQIPQSPKPSQDHKAGAAGGILGSMLGGLL